MIDAFMKEKFSELINLLSLRQIRIVDSHETVLFEDSVLEQKNNVNIETVQALGEQSPEFENSFVRFNVKYTFNFSREKDSVNKPYFTASYVIIVTFETLDVEKTRQLLTEKELLNVFITQQLKKTLWPVLRGTLLDAMGRHSLQPIPLPWIK